MLVDERSCRDAHTDEVEPLQFHEDAEAIEARDACGVHEAADDERTVRRELRRQRVKPLRAVERLILRAVDRIEGADPKRHGDAEDNGGQWKLSRHRDPAARRRHSDGNSQHQVTQECEALRIRIDQERHDGDGQKPKTDRSELRHRQDTDDEIKND